MFVVVTLCIRGGMSCSIFKNNEFRLKLYLKTKLIFISLTHISTSDKN